MSALRSSSEALIGASTGNLMRGVAPTAATAGSAPAPAETDACAAMPAFCAAVEPLRQQASSLFRSMVDLGAAGTGELAALGGEQARFMARVSERGFDCVFGPQPARSSEALMATAQAIGSDLMENAAAVGDRLVRLSTRNVERTTALFAAKGDRTSCCGGASRDGAAAN
jgi:hypothetical protein